MQLAPDTNPLSAITAIGTVVAIVAAIAALAVSWGRRGALQEMLAQQQTEFKTAMKDQGEAMTGALEHQAEEFGKAIEKLEDDRVTNDQLQLLVQRMEQGFAAVTKEFAGFAGRAGIIGDIEYLKKSMAEGFELQNHARHDRAKEFTGLLGALELRVKRLEDAALRGLGK